MKFTRRLAAHVKKLATATKFKKIRLDVQSEIFAFAKKDILIKHCPVKETDTTCPANEEYTEDGAGCQHTCASKASGIQVKCMPKSGCRCKTGFIRNDVTGQCIRAKSCPSEFIVRS